MMKEYNKMIIKNNIKIKENYNHIKLQNQDLLENKINKFIDVTCYQLG